MPRWANKIIIAKTTVRSATFDPNRTPRPNDGTFFSAELIEMKVSGKIEMMATMIKPITYLDKLKLLANLAEYLVAIAAPLITRNIDTMNMNRLLITFKLLK